MTRVIRIGALAAISLTGALSTALLKVQPSRRTAHSASSSVEPALDMVDAAFGGRVSEVLVRERDPVHSGDILVRLDNAELRHRAEEVSSARRSLSAALSEQGELRKLPPKVKQYLYTNYPDVVQADMAYNRALSAVTSTEAGDRAPTYERLSQAAEERVAARKHLQRLFSELTYPEGMHELLRRLDDDEIEVRRLLDRNEPKAAASGTVELLDLHPGDKVLPGAPVAMIRRTDVYTSLLTLSKFEGSSLHPGTQLTGALQSGRSVTGWIQSVDTRPVLAALRRQRSDSEESVISIRIDSAEKIEPDARIRFELP